MTKSQIDYLSKKLKAKSVHAYLGPNDSFITTFALQDDQYICIETHNMPVKERRTKELAKYYVGINFAYMFGHDTFLELQGEIDCILDYFSEE